MAFVQKQVAVGLDTTFASTVASAAFGNPLTNGSIILVAWEGDVGAQNSANTPTDTAGNTYIRVLSNSLTSTFDLEIWYAINTHTTANNVVTITDTIGGSDGIIIVEEWTGNVSSSPTDGSNSANGVAATSLNSGNFTTANANDLIWVAATVAAGANDLSAGAGFSNLTQTHTTFSNLGICSKTVSATGTYSGAMTSSASLSYIIGAVAIKQSASGVFTVNAMTRQAPNRAANY